jgi:hypothetical protein
VIEVQTCIARFLRSGILAEVKAAKVQVVMIGEPPLEPTEGHLVSSTPASPGDLVALRRRYIREG